ncbi:hypothetical protein BASA61_001054 [Batrachochytrium salamandrivorans]|nr:hypothetical protein BASA61_001054 [Batrachochytrium salamandrivorans]
MVRSSTYSIGLKGAARPYLRRAFVRCSSPQMRLTLPLSSTVARTLGLHLPDVIRAISETFDSLTTSEASPPLSLLSSTSGP